MTNNWQDIGNATAIVVWGANPVENHPACQAHMMRARYPKDYFSATDADPNIAARHNKKEADLIVIDPRKTRTALQCNPDRPGDRYIRQRPGTDIALMNGVLKYIMDTMESASPAYSDGTPIPAATVQKYFDYLNQGNGEVETRLSLAAYAGTFYSDGQEAGTVTDEAVVLNGTDVAYLAKANVSAIVVKDAPGGTAYTITTDYTESAANGTITRVDGGAIADGATVYVSYSYAVLTSATKAVPSASKYTDARFKVNATGTDYDREYYVNPSDPTYRIANFPEKAADCTDAGTVYSALKAHVAPYDFDTVKEITGVTGFDVMFIGDAFIKNSRCSSMIGAGPTANPSATENPFDTGYRSTTILYAMGMTQHTYGSQNVKSFAVIQTLMGNMGRSGGGINALRGIHNVQGSTDMGLLYGNIPAYSGNPGTQVDAIPSTNNAFGKYMDTLWGNPLSGAGTRTNMNGSYDDAYVKAAGNLQQVGFYNMTAKFFGDMSAQGDRTKTDAMFSLWPKGNGNNHIQMFRDMAAGTTKAAVVWGQNPAVTEPNQSKVREGLKALDLLVVTDIFETETAACDRKDGAVTYLLPSCSYVEKAGSVTNSGRAFQWRYQATLPQGDSHDDTELLIRLAKKLNDSTVIAGGGFSHIESVWSTYSVTANDAFVQLYQNPYGYDGVSTASYEASTGIGAVEYPDYTSTGLGATVKAATAWDTAYAATGSEAVNDAIFKEMARTDAYTIWIYVGGYDTSAVALNSAIAGAAAAEPRLQANYGTYWPVRNRAKSRSNIDPYGTFGFHKWGFSWLVNRRVLYNNGEIPGDQTDYFMGPDSASRLFVCKATPQWTTGAGASLNTRILNYARWYRTIHLLADTPDVTMPFSDPGTDLVPNPVYNASSPHFVSAGLTYAGRFPAHCEPYESPNDGSGSKVDLIGTWGQNTKGTTPGDLVLAGTLRGTSDDYPLVLTSIRCVEHFQGGPTTRNNWWNVAQEPEPWIEINSVDAINAGIKDGDMVKIITARNDEANTPAFTDSQIDAVYPRAEYGEGFRARVGVGLAKNQRVGQGVVAIPWHWGDRGLSTGSRANDLCIDAMDANTTIPEYKACLCKIEKM